MRRASLHLLKSLLQIVHCPATAWTCDIFRLVEPPAGSLHKFILEIFSHARLLYRYSVAFIVRESAGDVHLIQLFVQQSLTEVAREIVHQSFFTRGVIDCFRDLVSNFYGGQCRCDFAVISHLKVPSDRNFIDRILSQGNPYGIADSFRQKR